jgi:hypothetical protein
MQEWRYTPPFLTSALHDEWLISHPGRFTPGKESILNRRRLYGPQSRSGHRGVEKNVLSMPGIEPQLSLYQLSYANTQTL